MAQERMVALYPESEDAKSKHLRQQKQNSANAAFTEFNNYNYLTGNNRKPFMLEVGKESVKRQQDQMRQTADNEQTRLDAASAGHSTARAARQARVAAKYKGMK